MLLPEDFDPDFERGTRSLLRVRDLLESILEETIIEMVVKTLLFLYGAENA